MREIKKKIRNTLKNKYRKLFRKLILPATRQIYFIFPIKPHKIVFSNFAGRGFSDNPKYIAEEMHNRNDEIDMVWLVDDVSLYSFPDYIRVVSLDSIRGTYERATAKVWIDNIRNFHPIKKRNEQIYLQTWHAPYSPKLLEKDAEDKLSEEYCREAKYDGSITDGIICDSALLEEQYKRAFWLNPKVEFLKYGLPRFDFLINYGDKGVYTEKIKEKYSISKDVYLVLYAPTFRDDGSEDGYKLDFDGIINAFENKFGMEVKLILRFHPNVIYQSKSINYTSKIINGSYIDDIQELSIISDAIITDYSSSFFDFVLLNRPVFLCTLDLDKYIETRGLLKEFFDFPFPRAKTNEDFINIINNFSRDEYDKRVKDYFEKHPMYNNGNASQRVVDWILKKMNYTDNRKGH